jgi:hypothetical protein
VRNTGTTQQENSRVEITKLPQAQQLCRAERPKMIGNITSLIELRGDLLQPPYGTNNADVAIK